MAQPVAAGWVSSEFYAASRSAKVVMTRSREQVRVPRLVYRELSHHIRQWLAR